MQSLAPELILEILEKVYYSKDGTPDRNTLASCSLISPAWTSQSQKLLFRSLVFKEGFKAASFDLAAGLQPHFLAENIRILQVAVETSTHAVSPQLFALIVTKCVRLYELRIWSFVHSLDNVTLALLSRIPPIKALSILRTSIHSNLLYQLLSLLPSVKHLRLLSELHAAPPLEPAKFSLYELIIHRAPHPDVMAWLLGVSHSSLRILEMWDMCTRDTIKSIMQTQGPHLRSLRFFRFNHEAALLVRRCSSLEEIVLLQVPTVIDLLPLPSTIQHLAFRDPAFAHATFLAPIVAAVSKLPSLRIVTCDEGTTRHDQFEMVRMACMQRGVELRVDALPFTVYEDMVPVTRFPRLQSVSNFNLMN